MGEERRGPAVARAKENQRFRINQVERPSGSTTRNIRRSLCTRPLHGTALKEEEKRATRPAVEGQGGKPNGGRKRERQERTQKGDEPGRGRPRYSSNH